MWKLIMIISIDIGVKNLSWFITENNVLIDWNRHCIFGGEDDDGDEMNETNQKSRSIGKVLPLFISFIQKELFEKFLINKECIFIIEKQVMPSTTNQTLAISFINFARTTPIIKLKGIVNYTSKAKFKLTEKFFNEKIIKNEKFKCKEKFIVPTTNSMKKASINRTEEINRIYKQGLVSQYGEEENIIELPLNYKEFIQKYDESKKKDDMSDSFLQWLAFKLDKSPKLTFQYDENSKFNLDSTKKRKKLQNKKDSNYLNKKIKL